MSILFHLGHPAHFHLFKNVILKLQKEGHIIHILIKDKDVLRKLLDHSGFDYVNILPEGKSAGKTGLFKDLFRRGRRMITYCKRHKPDLLIGTSADISYVGKLLNIPAVNVNEDDAHVVPMHAWISYPGATSILSPESCDNGRWNKKTEFYPGYHELAYLHPDHFNPDPTITSKYTNPDKPYFILRFASLNAHHDSGIRGVNDSLAGLLIEKLKPYGDILITSERPLTKQLEPYRIPVDPIDMHHLLAHAKLVIGDSQTMSAEAGVLGTPFIRYNDFVGRIGYLNELENKYKLGFGIIPDHPEELLKKAEELAASDETEKIFMERKELMLKAKINVADFLYRYISERQWKNGNFEKRSK
ncbi:DUF354 domain-containing protein [Balneolaceae bacterium ANBcel3]|nr:DUF354 domain-containing protein [Balneolaceae bacterium ANBcel3]